MRAKNLSSEQRDKKAEQSREYKASKRRENGVRVRRLKNPSGRYGEGRAMQKTGWFLHRRKLLRYLDQYTTEQYLGNNGRGRQNLTLFLNGRRLEENDMRYIQRMRDDEMSNINYDRIEQIATRYELPMWEIEQVAGIREAG